MSKCWVWSRLEGKTPKGTTLQVWYRWSFGAIIICPPTLIIGCIPSYSLVQLVLPRVYWGYTTFTTKGAGPLVGGAILLTRVLQVSTALHSTFTGLRTTGRSLGICLRQARRCSSAVFAVRQFSYPSQRKDATSTPNFREKWKTNNQTKTYVGSTPPQKKKTGCQSPSGLLHF